MGIQSKVTALYKKRRIKRYLEFHQSPCDLVQSDANLLHAIHYPSLELSNRQWSIVLADSNIYVEEHGTFLELVRRFERSVQYTIDKAQWVVFPFNLGCLYSPEWTHDDHSLFLEEVEVLRHMVAGRPIVFFSTFDFSFVRNRTTYPEVLLQSSEDLKRFEWILDSDKIIQFECTRDHQSQVPAFPLVSFPPLDPHSKPRPYLFSFVGQITKSHWPGGFVRSPTQRESWKRLAEEFGAEAFIGTKQQAQKLGFSNPYAALPARSVFTLCPRGIAAWTFRLFEAILCGSIPVILSDAYITPFDSTIGWDSFCLQLAERDLSEVGHILNQIDSTTVADMQERLSQAQHHFVADGLWQNLQSHLGEVERLGEGPTIESSPALADLGMPVPDAQQKATRRLVNTVAAYQLLTSEADSVFERHLENFLREDRDGPPSNESLLISCVDSHLQVKGQYPEPGDIQFRETTLLLKEAAHLLDKGAFSQGALMGALGRTNVPRRATGWEGKSWLRPVFHGVSHYAICESLLNQSLLEEVLCQLKMARWSARKHHGIGEEQVVSATPTILLLNFLLNSEHFLSEVEMMFELESRSLQYGSGQIYRLRSGDRDYDSWHDDVCREEGRRIAFVLGLSENGFDGGDWVLRSKNKDEELARVSLAKPGKAVLFRVDPALEHRVEPVVGDASRDVFAGWLRTKPLGDWV